MKRSVPLADPQERQLVTYGLKAAAKIVGLHEQTLLARARRGVIPGACKPGKCWVFIEDGLREYLLSISTYRGPLMKPSALSAPTTKEGYAALLGLPTRRESKRQREFDARLGLPKQRKRRKQAWP